jgi:hypothetical protein
MIYGVNCNSVPPPRHEQLDTHCYSVAPREACYWIAYMLALGMTEAWGSVTESMLLDRIHAGFNSQATTKWHNPPRHRGSWNMHFQNKQHTFKRPRTCVGPFSVWTQFTVQIGKRRKLPRGMTLAARIANMRASSSVNFELENAHRTHLGNDPNPTPVQDGLQYLDRIHGVTGSKQ